MYPQGSTPRNSSQPRFLQLSIDPNNHQYRNIASQLNKQSLIASPQTPTKSVSSANSVRFIQTTTPRQPPNILFNPQNKLFLDSNKISFLNANSNQFLVQQNQKNVQISNEFSTIHQNQIPVDQLQKLGCQNINNSSQVQNNVQRQQVAVPVICSNDNAQFSDKIKDFLKYYVVKSSNNNNNTTNNNQIVFEMVQSSPNKNVPQSTLSNSPPKDQAKQSNINKITQNQLFQKRIQQQLEKLQKHCQEPLASQQQLPPDKPPKRVYRKRVIDKNEKNGQEPKRRRQTKKSNKDNTIQNALDKDLVRTIVNNHKINNNDINTNNSSITNTEETSNIPLDKKTLSSNTLTDDDNTNMFCMVPQQTYTIYLPDGTKHHAPLIFSDDLPGLFKSQNQQNEMTNHLGVQTSNHQNSSTSQKQSLLATPNKSQPNHVNTSPKNNQVNNKAVSGALVGNNQIQKTPMIKQEATHTPVLTTPKVQCTTPQNKVTFMDMNSDSNQQTPCNSMVKTPTTSMAPSTKLLQKKSATMPLFTTPHHNSQSTDVVQILISDEEEEDVAIKNDLMNKSLESAIQNNDDIKTPNHTAPCLLSQWPIIKEEKILFNLHLKQLLFYGSNIHASNYCTFTLNNILFYKHKKHNPDDRNTNALSAKNFVFHLPLRNIKELRLHHGLCGPLIFLKTNLSPQLVQLFKIQDVFDFDHNEDQGDLQYFVLIPNKDNLSDHTLIPRNIATSTEQSPTSSNDASNPVSLPSSQLPDVSSSSLQQNLFPVDSISTGDNDIKNTDLIDENLDNSDAKNINEGQFKETLLDSQVDQISSQCEEKLRSAEIPNPSTPTISVNSTIQSDDQGVACMNTPLISTQVTSSLSQPTIFTLVPPIAPCVPLNSSQLGGLNPSNTLSSMTNCIETSPSVVSNATMPPNVVLSLVSLASIASIKGGLNLNNITNGSHNASNNNATTIATIHNNYTETTTTNTIFNTSNVPSHEASSLTSLSVDNGIKGESTSFLTSTSCIPTTSSSTLNPIPTPSSPILSPPQSIPTITKQPITPTRSETITTASSGSSSTMSISLDTKVTTTPSVAQKPLITSQPLISSFFCEMINEVWLQAGVKVDFSEVKGDWAKEKVESIAKVSDKQKQNQTPVQEKQPQPNKQALQLKPSPIILSSQQQHLILQIAQQQQQLMIQQQQLNTPQTFVKSTPQQIIPNSQLLVTSDKNTNNSQVFYLLTPDNQLHKLSTSSNVTISQQTTKVHKCEDDIDRSRSQSPLPTSFIGPIIKYNSLLLSCFCY